MRKLFGRYEGLENFRFPCLLVYNKPLAAVLVHNERKRHSLANVHELPFLEWVAGKVSHSSDVSDLLRLHKIQLEQFLDCSPRCLSPQLCEAEEDPCCSGRVEVRLLFDMSEYRLHSFLSVSVAVLRRLLASAFDARPSPPSDAVFGDRLPTGERADVFGDRFCFFVLIHLCSFDVVWS